MWTGQCTFFHVWAVTAISMWTGNQWKPDHFWSFSSPRTFDCPGNDSSWLLPRSLKDNNIGDEVAIWCSCALEHLMGSGGHFLWWRCHWVHSSAEPVMNRWSQCGQFKFIVGVKEKIAFKTAASQCLDLRALLCFLPLWTNRPLSCVMTQTDAWFP